MLLKEQSQVIRLQRLSQPFRIADARARKTYEKKGGVIVLKII